MYYCDNVGHYCRQNDVSYTHFETGEMGELYSEYTVIFIYYFLLLPLIPREKTGPYADHFLLPTRQHLINTRDLGEDWVRRCELCSVGDWVAGRCALVVAAYCSCQRPKQQQQQWSRY